MVIQRRYIIESLSQPSGSTVYPLNSIGAWSKKLNRQLADMIKHCQNESFDGRH